MPELTPQQKLLEQLYRNQSAQKSPDLSQQKVQSKYNSPSAPVSRNPANRGGTISQSVLKQSNLRKVQQKNRAEFSKFKTEVSASASKFKTSSAVNISKFGGGVKAKLSPTLTAAKTIAVRQGVKGASLGRMLANSRFLAGANSFPVLALTVGNYVVWKKNIQDIKKIYDYGNTPVNLTLPITRDVIVPAGQPPFQGGQSVGVVYLVQGVRAKGGINYCETPVLNNNWSFYVPGPIHGIASKQIRTDDRYDCATYTQILGKTGFYSAYVNYGSDPLNDQYSMIQFTDPHTVNTVVKITSVTRADGLPDTGGNLPSSDSIYSQGDTNITNVTNVTNVTNITNPARDTTAASNKPPVQVINNYFTTPASEAKAELPPAIAPAILPVPGDNAEKTPQSPTDTPPVKLDDPVKSKEVEKKPKFFSGKTINYATPEQMEEINRLIEADKKKNELTTDLDFGIETDFSVGTIESIAENQARNKASTNSERSTRTTQKFLYKPTTTVIPTVERPTETETDTDSDNNVRVIPPPVPGYQLKDAKSTTQSIPTPVDSCKKGCGGTPASLNSTDSANLQKAAALGQTADLGLLAVINTKLGALIPNGGISAVLTNGTYGLKAVQEFASKAWQATHADKILNAVTTAVVIHNGVMLSRNLGQTIGDAATVTLQAMGLKDPTTGEPFDVTQLAGAKLTQLIQTVIGQGNYEALTTRIASNSRIYQSVANMADLTFSLFDSARNIAETSATNTGKIGNALREAGAVYEDAYTEMSEKYSPQNAAMRKLSGLTTGIGNISEGVDRIAQVSGGVVEIQESYTELKTEKATLEQEVKEALDLKEKEKAVAKKAVQAQTELDKIDFTKYEPPT